MAKIRLGDMATVVTKGTTPTTIGFRFEDSGINFVKIESISEDGTFLKEKFSHISDECNVQMRRSQLQENDILFSIAGAIGRSAIVTKEILPANTNQALAIIRVPKGKIDYNYLLYALSSSAINQQATQHQQGVAQLNISLKNVSDFLLPIYTEAMQKRIVHNLKKIDKLIFLRKQQLAKLDELVKARFVEMFGDPVTNPKGYEKYKLENLARKISDGVHSKPDYTETGRPFLSVVNINKGVINFKNCKYVSEDAYQKMIKSTHPERGDVLYTKVGATYGIPAYVDTDIAFCLYVSVCLIKPKREVINPRFLSLSMEMPYVKHQADRRIKGIGVPDLHLNQISEFEILCPPLKEQDIFIYFVERLDGEKRVVQQSLEKLELMKKALMQEYFG